MALIADSNRDQRLIPTCHSKNAQSNAVSCKAS
jgi:hypothetical protein